ncbi:MAG: AMP-binding protein, partial [Bryobacteraceae bacterium]
MKPETQLSTLASPDSPESWIHTNSPDPAWNRTASDYPRDRSVHELFEEHAQRTPGAIALLCGSERLTYGELNARANRLAHRLREYGVGREVLVACCLERSFDLVVALLAVLKAGGAYVPLDSAYPAERLTRMIADTAAPVLLAHPHLLSGLPRTAARIVTLDNPDLVLQPAENPQSCSGARDLAYVMYTSGSTGTPKGVMIEHRSIVRLVRNTNFIGIGPDDVFLQLAPASFDAATLEIWAPLLNGAQLAIMPPRIPSLEEIGAAIRSFGVTTLWLTAGLFHRMVDE